MFNCLHNNIYTKQNVTLFDPGLRVLVAPVGLSYTRKEQLASFVRQYAHDSRQSCLEFACLSSLRKTWLVSGGNSHWLRTSMSFRTWRNIFKTIKTYAKILYFHAVRILYCSAHRVPACHELSWANGFVKPRLNLLSLGDLLFFKENWTNAS